LGYAATAFLYVLFIVLSMLVGVAGVALIQRLIPVERRKPHNTAIGTLYGGVYILFGVIIGFTALIVLNKYNAARVTVESEATDVARIYQLAQELPESKREEIQGLAESYVRVVVEEEWPLMRQGKTSPRAQALADNLRSAIQEFKPTTNNEQEIYSQEIDAVNDLDRDRVARLLDVRHGMPPLLWIALFVLTIPMLLFACLMGIEDTQLHMLGVAALVGGIAVVLITILALDHPFGTEFRLGPQPFEFVLHKIEGTSPVGSPVGEDLSPHSAPKVNSVKANFAEFFFYDVG
jgi:hypothetical protein